MSEDKLHDARVNGAKAKSLIEDETLQGAFTALRQTYTEKLFETSVDQTAEREKLYIAYRVVTEVQRHLQSLFDSGKLADAELNRLVMLAKPKSKWENV